MHVCEINSVQVDKANKHLINLVLVNFIQWPCFYL